MYSLLLKGLDEDELAEELGIRRKDIDRQVKNLIGYLVRTKQLVDLEAYFKAHPGAGEAAIVLARNGAVQSITWGGKRYVPRTEIYVVSEFLARIKLVPKRSRP